MRCQTTKLKLALSYSAGDPCSLRFAPIYASILPRNVGMGYRVWIVASSNARIATCAAVPGSMRFHRSLHQRRCL